MFLMISAKDVSAIWEISSPVGVQQVEVPSYGTTNFWAPVLLNELVDEALGYNFW